MNGKKVWLFAGMLLLMLLCAQAALAYEITADGWKYEVVDETAVITGYTGEFQAEVVIPSKVDGYSVTAIGGQAFYYNTGITSVVIPEGVTAIQDGSGVSTGAKGAFSKCTGLKSITLPSTLESIGSYAFLGCTGLDHISFPQNLKAIRSGAFNGCTGLTQLELPSGLTTILSQAFAYCSGLTAVSLPDSVTKVYSDSFSYCTGVKHFRWTAGVPEYPTGIHLTAVEEIVLPEGVTAIASGTSYNKGAFYDLDSLKSVSLPSTLETIGKYAFRDCDALVDIQLPESVTVIPDYAFYNCNSLQTISLPGNLTAISAFAFAESGLKTISMPDSVTTLGASAFYGCDDLNDVGLSFSLTEIPDSCFAYCYALKKVTIPESVKKLGYECFYYCTSIELYLPSSATEIGTRIVDQSTAKLYMSVGCETSHLLSGYNYYDRRYPDFMFRSMTKNGVRHTALVDYTGSAAEVTVPMGVTLIDEYNYDSPFEDNRTLEKVNLPEGLVDLGEAFRGCTMLKSVNLPSTLTTMNSYAFYDCSSITELHLPDNMTYAWFPAHITLYVRYNSTTAKSLSSYDFIDPSFATDLTLLWKKDENEAYTLWVGKYIGSGTECTVPAGVNGIDTCAFENQKTLTKIVLPEGLNSIGDSAFRFCEALQEIMIPEGVTSIGDSAFRSCEALQEIMIPEGVTSIGDYAFYSCEALQEIILPQTLTSIGEYAFCYCAALQKITIPEGVTSIGVAAFHSCEALQEITLPQTLTSIGVAAFRYCEALQEITFPQSISSIGERAFGACTSLVDITFPQKHIEMGESVFDSCTSLQEVALPTGQKHLNTTLFANCSALKVVDLPEGLLTIGDGVFSRCDSLKTISIPSTVTAIGKTAFYDCDNLLTLTIPEGVTELKESLAAECEKMTSIVLPRSVTVIADNAFNENYATVYCYRGSHADTWAQGRNMSILYLDDGGFGNYVSLTGESEVKTDHGNRFNWRGLVSVYPYSLTEKYTLTCTSSDPSVASVSGDSVSLLKQGSATLTVKVKEISWLSHTIQLTVYNPVESFRLPNVYANRTENSRVEIRPQNVTPANTDPVFHWKDSRYSNNYYEEVHSVYQTNTPFTLTATAPSGVKRSCRVVFYSTIGALRFGTFSTAVLPGMYVQPQVVLFLDNVAYADPALYTLQSSNTSVAVPQSDGRLYIKSAGTAVITATSMDGQKATQTLTVKTASNALSLPAAIVTVESEAFTGSAMSIVIVPDGCVTIESRAFANCTKLKTVYLPSSVTEIADDAFSGCSGLTIVAPGGSTAAEYAYEKGYTLVNP